MSTEPRKFDFDESRVEEKILDFRRVVMDDEQREIADEISKHLGKHIDIFHNTLRSFVSLSISLWQTAEKKLLKDMSDQPSDVRIRAVNEIAGYLRSLLTGLLRNKGQTADLENAITSAIELYANTWATR